jgi:hypothetical protein
MGVAVGDFDNNGRPALLTTTFFDDYFPLFRQDQSGFFDDVASSSGVEKVTRTYLGWACGFADFDNDGRLDLWLANGHVYPKSPHYFQPFTVLRNNTSGFVKVLTYPAPPDNSYRGGCAGDFDNDGKIDVLVLPIAGQPLLLQNRTETSNAWIALQLRGTRSNRDAIGASVQVGYCGTSQFDTVRNGGSYLSRDDPRLHFGLGACSRVDNVAIQWPSGAKQVLKNLPLNRVSIIEEPR